MLTSLPQVQLGRGLGEGHAGPVRQEGEQDDDAAADNTDNIVATDQYSPGSALMGTRRRTCWTRLAGR